MDGDYISKQSDIVKIYGNDNVNRWANPDNDEDFAAILDRIDWSNEYAEQEFLGRIAEGPYDLDQVRTLRPKMAIRICASLAGLSLYDTRRIVDSQDSTNRTARQKKDSDKWIAQIMGGQLKLLDPTTYTPLKKLAQNSPFAVSGN